MITLKQTLVDYSNHRELTAKEKEMIAKEYNKCVNLGLSNFVSKIVSDNVRRVDAEIPEDSICAYVSQLSA